MGVSIDYQAIPLRLLETLKQNKSYLIIVGSMWGEGNGMFHWFDEPESDWDDSDIGYLIDCLPTEEPELFPSSTAVEEIISQLHDLFKEIQVDYPGIEERCAYFEKTQNDIEQLLIDDLEHNAQHTSPEQIRQMMYGSSALAEEYELFYVLPEELTRFLPFAQTIDPDRLLAQFDFGDRQPLEVWYEDMYKEISWFKDCLIEAEKLQEAILIGHV